MVFEQSADGMVEVHRLPDFSLPYRERRGPWGFKFGVSFENFLPTNYISPADQASYNQIFGSTPVPVLQMNTGFQYNSQAGAIGLDFFYGSGAVSSSTTKLSISRAGVGLTYAMDALFAEPYIVPYISGQAYILNYDESGTSGSTTFDVSGQTALAISYSIGLLIQLNALDREGAHVALVDWGLSNTYLDIFGIQHTGSTRSSDPNFQTSFDLGAGLRLEF